MINLGWASIARFCTGKSYTSTFKIRSRLAQFFKHVHPDQLSQAPIKIKQENMRSLTNFNSYIDCISQSKSSEAKLLKFYIAEKTNMKSKKFFSFTVELPEIKGAADNSNSNTQKLVDNIVEVLNRKFAESKTFKTKHGKVSQFEKVENIRVEDKETEEERIDRMTAKINPFKRTSKLTEQQAQNLKNTLNSKYMQAQKQSLSAKLLNKISFANTGSHKHMMWSRLATDQKGVYDDYKQIMDELIDPRLIYFDETLTNEEVDQFKSRLLPGQMNLQNYKDSKIIIQLCAKMESFEPPLCFYVSRKYSSTEIPGFFTIPYNFKAVQLGNYFQKQVETVIQEQTKFQQYFDYYNQLKLSLQVQNKLYIDQIQFRNNPEIWGHILTLKRLQKYNTPKKTKIVIFDKQRYELFTRKYGLETKATVLIYEGKIVSRVDFVETDMETVMGQFLCENTSVGDGK